MKKLLLLGLLAVPSISLAQNVNFTDVNFKNKLLSTYGTYLDTNNDGEIQLTEAQSFTGMMSIEGTSANPGNITDLSGISAFTNITALNCRYNQITAIDLSNNPLVETLFASNNNLVSLNISACTALKTLQGSNNELTTLNLSNNTGLTIVNLSGNNLTALDVSACSELFTLMCPNNNLTTLDISSNTALSTLSCDNNQLTTLNVAENSALALLNCTNNMLTELNLSNNTALNYLSCSDNQLTQLDLTNTPALINLSCWNNELASLNLSFHPQLTDLHCHNNPTTSINVGANEVLARLNCANTNISTLDLSGTWSLTSLHCSNIEELTYLNLKNGNNNAINQATSFFQNLPNLETVCLDNEDSALANYIVDQVVHEITIVDICATMGIEEKHANNFLVFPNPVTDWLQVKSEAPVTQIEVYNSLGSRVMMSDNSRINLAGLGSGMYIIRISDNEGNTTIKKIVKK